MTDTDPHKKQWESLRDQAKSLYDSTGDQFQKERYEACKRLLGEDQETPTPHTFIG